jgi:hypothetical protein
VNLFNAIVVVNDISLKQQDIRMESKEMVLDLSFNEILDLVFTKEKELSTAYITLSQTHVTYEKVDVTFSSLDAKMEGKVSLVNIDDSHLYSLDVVVFDFIYTQLEDNFNVRGDQGNLFFVGDIDRNTQTDTLASFIKVMDIAHLEINNPEFIFSPGQKSSIPLLNASSTWLKDDNNFKGDSIKVKLSSDKKVLVGESILIDFPLIILEGGFRVSSSGFFTTNLAITHLEEAIIEELNPILGFFGYNIPNEPFTIDVDSAPGERPLKIEITPIQ